LAATSFRSPSALACGSVTYLTSPLFVSSALKQVFDFVFDFVKQAGRMSCAQEEGMYIYRGLGEYGLHGGSTPNIIIPMITC